MKMSNSSTKNSPFRKSSSSKRFGYLSKYNNRSSLSNLFFQPKSEISGSINIKNCYSKAVNKKIISKCDKLFEKLEKNSPQKTFHKFSQIISNFSSSSMLKSSFEKNLHEEYVKDRQKFKLGNCQYISNKKIWRPDSNKTLRKAEKLLISMPKIRS